MAGAIEELLFDVVVEGTALLHEQPGAGRAGRDLDGLATAETAHTRTVGEHLCFVYRRGVAHPDDMIGSQHEGPEPERVRGDEVEHESVGVPDHERSGARKIVGRRARRRSDDDAVAEHLAAPRPRPLVDEPQHTLRAHPGEHYVVDGRPALAVPPG